MEDGTLEKVEVDESYGNIEQALQGIESLQQQIGSDPELVKASVLIRRQERRVLSKKTSAG